MSTPSSVLSFWSSLVLLSLAICLHSLFTLTPLLPPQSLPHSLLQRLLVNVTFNNEKEDSNNNIYNYDNILQDSSPLSDGAAQHLFWQSKSHKNEGAAAFFECLVRILLAMSAMLFAKGYRIRWLNSYSVRRRSAVALMAPSASSAAINASGVGVTASPSLSAAGAGGGIKRSVSLTGVAQVEMKSASSSSASLEWPWFDGFVFVVALIGLFSLSPPQSVPLSSWLPLIFSMLIFPAATSMYFYEWFTRLILNRTRLDYWKFGFELDPEEEINSVSPFILYLELVATKGMCDAIEQFSLEDEEKAQLVSIRKEFLQNVVMSLASTRAPQGTNLSGSQQPQQLQRQLPPPSPGMHPTAGASLPTGGHLSLGPNARLGPMRGAGSEGDIRTLRYAIDRFLSSISNFLVNKVHQRTEKNTRTLLSAIVESPSTTSFTTSVSKFFEEQVSAKVLQQLDSIAPPMGMFEPKSSLGCVAYLLISLFIHKRLFQFSKSTFFNGENPTYVLAVKHLSRLYLLVYVFVRYFIVRAEQRNSQ